MALDAPGNLLTQNGIGTPYGASARSGTIWTVGTATLFAPEVAFSATLAKLEIWNGSTTFEYEVLDLYAAQILSTAAQQTYAIFAQVSKPVAAGPSVTALSVFSCNGLQSYSAGAGSGRLVTGVGTTVVANGWRPWGNPQAWGLATATPGNAWSAEVNGKLVVPPQSSLCISIVGALATASTFQCGATLLERTIIGTDRLVA